MQSAYELILKHYKGNDAKAVEWFVTTNPGLGDVTPLVMLEIGQYQTLLAFINTI